MFERALSEMENINNADLEKLKQIELNMLKVFIYTCNELKLKYITELLVDLLIFSNNIMTYIINKNNPKAPIENKSFR